LLLAELGARVIKVEPPGQGDDARQYGPFKNGKSTYFASVNRGKQSIALDFKSPDGRNIFERLLDKADAVVENLRPGTMEKLGYGWDRLHPRYPRLIYAAASGFGSLCSTNHHVATRNHSHCNPIQVALQMIAIIIRMWSRCALSPSPSRCWPRQP
jgi:crotonobetainyl-CoA:carnitine CoA-transferase CaiB-like acyl-CoA transferase